jgi:hypothetical protein
MNRFLWLFALLTAFACGAQDPQDDDDSEAQDDDTEIGSLEQAISSVVWPGGDAYGNRFGTNGVACGASWPGDCMVPRDKVLRFKFDTTKDQLFSTGLLLSQYFAIAADRVCQNLNEIGGGWNCARTTGSSNEIVGGGSLSGTPSPLGRTDFTNVLSQRLTLQGKGKLAFSNGCTITISRSNFQANPNWPFYTTPQQDAQVVNTIQHELYHCAGLPHNPTVGTLMYFLSDDASFYESPTTAERQRLFQYFVTE